MEVNFILNPKTFQNACFLCFKESANTVNIDEVIEIHQKGSTGSVTLRNITKYLFSSYEILLHQACNDCADLILKIFILLKRATIKINAIAKLICNIDEEMITKNSDLNQLFIKVEKNSKIRKELVSADAESNLDHKCLFNCNVCSIKFESEAELKIHKKMTHTTTNKSLVCVTCGKFFKKTTLLKVHMLTHKQIECPYCFKLLKNNTYYKTHVKNHIKRTKRIVNTRYKCDDCSHETHNKVDLASHMNKYHLKIRPYVCQKCTKRFYSQRNLNEHILTHVNDKAYTCEQCGDNFSGKPSLNNHLKLHDGHRPYKCTICHHSFVSASRKNEHEKRKHGTKQFPCSECNKKYCLKKTLNYHMKTIHGVTKTNVVSGIPIAITGALLKPTCRI